jgi:hypothetical protein
VLDANPDLTQETSERIVDQALAFVATAAGRPDVPVAPSRVVDEGWHALILNTRIHQRLTARLGRTAHHQPEPPGGDRDPAWLTRTTEAIRAAGFAVDEELWRGPDDDTIPVAARAQHTPVPEPPIVIEPKPKKTGAPQR